MSRHTVHAVTVKRFLDGVNLCSLWEHHNIGFTHVHNDLSSVSTLDHFICNERLLAAVKSCGLIHLGDNQSRHPPIMMKLDVGALPLKLKPEFVVAKRPARYKATVDQYEAYRVTLERKIEAMNKPECLEFVNKKSQIETNSEDRDRLVLDLLGAVVESSHATIPMVGGRQGAARPDSGRVPGWREQAAPFRKDLLFWHSMWLSADRPNVGQLYKVVKRTKNKCHHALRKVREAAENLNVRSRLNLHCWGAEILSRSSRR